jgi:hypothetical protein
MKPIVLLVLLLVMPVHAAEPQWQLLGKGRYTKFFLHIYVVSLEAPQREFHFPDSAPYALTMQFEREVDAEDIIDGVLDEWKDQKLKWPPTWREFLTRMVPDMKVGDRLRMEVNADHTARALHNGKVLTTLDDPALINAFAGIWLSERTTHTRIHRQLLEHSQ